MIRRFPWGKLFVAASCLVPSGCEPHHSWHRDKDDDDAKAIAAGNPTEDDMSARKVIGGGPGDDTSSFFKGSRRAGGWSSEAQEIESHLGAN